jgi:hypothetical protein
MGISQWDHGSEVVGLIAEYLIKIFRQFPWTLSLSCGHSSAAARVDGYRPDFRLLDGDLPAIRLSVFLMGITQRVPESMNIDLISNYWTAIFQQLPERFRYGPTSTVS